MLSEIWNGSSDGCWFPLGAVLGELLGPDLADTDQVLVLVYVTLEAVRSPAAILVLLNWSGPT